MFARSLLILTIGLALSLFSPTGYAQPSYPMQDGVLIVSSFDTNPCLDLSDVNVEGFACNSEVQIVDFNKNEQLDCLSGFQVKYDYLKWPHPIISVDWGGTWGGGEMPLCYRSRSSFNIDAKNSSVMVYAVRERPALPRPAHPGSSEEKLNFVWAYDRSTSKVRLCVLYKNALPQCKDVPISDWSDFHP
jgi:hypothetical protein